MIWRLPCGKYSLFAIEDGFFFREPDEMFPEAGDGFWARHPGWLHDGRLRLSLGCFLLTDGHDSVMIDTGMGSQTLPDPEAVTGQMPAALSRIGIPAEAISRVVHTHLHFDHIGGNRKDDGHPFMPNARYSLHDAEWDYWSEEDSVPAERARSMMSGFIEDGSVDLIDRDTEILPGVVAIESPGHTPGHLSVEIISQGTRTMIIGDVAHHPAQTTNPKWSITADVDKDLAARTRDRVFDVLLGSGTTMAAGHFEGLGIGTIEMDDSVRVFVPGSPAPA